MDGMKASEMVPYEVYKVGKQWKVKLGFGIETYTSKKVAEHWSKQWYDLDSKEGKILQK